jgi:3-oxoacyl-[acyl-carrier protein] reductase
MSSLKGKVAIVTGASKGIGAGIAKHFAAAGAAVIVNYASDRPGAERVVAEIVAKDGRAVAVHGDVAKAEDVEALFVAAKQHFGRVDIVMNNAGVFAFAPIEGLSPEDFHRQFDINVLGTLLMTRGAARHFGPEGGSVINNGSVVSQNPPPGSSVYSATKGAVDTLTIALSRELASKKIRVNVIAPGGTYTEGAITAGVVGSDLEKSIIAQTPLGRLGQPDDIAKIAVFLASDQSSWLTGERIGAAGGFR